MATTTTIVDLELGPLERTAGVAHIGDAQLDDGPLKTGDSLMLRDEGGFLYDATVTDVEKGAYGQHYRVKFVSGT